MNKEDQISLVEEIIETAYKLLTHNLALGGVKVNNEAAFQLELGYILKTLGQLYEFRLVDKFHLEFESIINLKEKSVKSKSRRARVDILIRYKDDNETTTAVLELKFFKKENHREPNNRYDVFKDLSNLETYKANGIDICNFMLVTDHLHYVNQNNYSPDTSDFDFRDGKKYTSGKVLQYRTEKPYGPNISLKQSYEFVWSKLNDLYFLKLKI